VLGLEFCIHVSDTALELKEKEPPTLGRWNVVSYHITEWKAPFQTVRDLRHDLSQTCKLAQARKP
jgi:hypothetical protein